MIRCSEPFARHVSVAFFSGLLASCTVAGLTHLVPGLTNLRITEGRSTSHSCPRGSRFAVSGSRR
jgi:hypothetical protein